MSEFLELTAPPPKPEVEPFHEYFKPAGYKLPEIGTPLTVRMHDITDESKPESAIDPITGFATRCIYNDEETLAISLDEQSVKAANIGEYKSKYPSHVQAVQPGIHTVLVNGEIRRFAITFETTSSLDVLEAQS